MVEGGPAQFDVEMSIPSTQSVTVDYQTTDGSARAGMDYTAASDTLTFEAGDPEDHLGADPG